MPVDYQKGKIYTIRCYDDDSLIYVGSTTQPLAVRWGDHKQQCNKDNPKVSIVKLMQNKGKDRFYIELYEDFPCDRKEQLMQREGEVQRLIATVNKRIESRTKKEWHIDNKKNLKVKRKLYYENNKEQIAEKHKKYRENNKENKAEYDKKYQDNNKAKIAEKSRKYYENNKEKSLHRRKKYYENNKEKELARMAEKITCDRCGIVICKRSLRRHQKTKKCEELCKNNICPIINDE